MSTARIRDRSTLRGGTWNSCAGQVHALSALRRLKCKSKLLEAIQVCVFLGRWFQGLLLIYLWKFYVLCRWVWISKPLGSNILYCKVRALSNEAWNHTDLQFFVLVNVQGVSSHRMFRSKVCQLTNTPFSASSLPSPYSTATHYMSLLLLEQFPHLFPRISVFILHSSVHSMRIIFMYPKQR